jgi:lysophospholipase L1-like esterase
VFSAEAPPRTPTDSELRRLYVETPTGMRLRPNARVVVVARTSRQTVEIRTNSLGFRGAPIGEKRGLRILFLGDSITEAGYLPEEETFVSRVQQNAREQGRDWETINAGVEGAGLGNEIAILRERGVAVTPDVVVLGFYLNDFDSSPGVYLPAVPQWMEWSRLARYLAMASAVLLPSATARSFEPVEIDALREEWVKDFPVGTGDYRIDRGAFNLVLYKWFFDFGGGWCPHLWTWMQPLFDQFRHLSDVHRFAPAIVMFPVRHQVEADFLYDDPQRRMREVAGRLGIPLLDLLPVLRRAHRSSPQPLFFDHCHTTAYGSRLVANEITKFLAGLPAASHVSEE